MKEFYENGNLKQSIPYKNGIQEGMTESFYQNGIKKSEILYINGEQNGDYILYYPNGNKKSESFLVDKKRIYKTYSLDGKLISEKTIK